MDEYDDFGSYNGDPDHDALVDYTYHMNTGELSDLFGDSDADSEDTDDEE